MKVTNIFLVDVSIAANAMEFNKTYKRKTSEVVEQAVQSSR